MSLHALNHTISAFKRDASYATGRLMDLEPTQETNGPRPARSPPASHGKPDSDGFSWLQLLELAFLTFNSAVALYRSRSEPWGVAFVATSYVDLLLLFWGLRRFESTPDGSPHRRILKMAVWSLSTLRAIMLSYHVAAIMPRPVAVVVWAIAGLTTGGFYAFFIYKEKNPTEETNGQRPAPGQPAGHGMPDSDGFSWLQPLGLAFLTFNSVVALYRSRSDPWRVAFVTTSYVDLLLLFWCLRRFESKPDGSPNRGILKMAVRSLSTLRTIMVSYHAAATMPLPVAVVMWALAGLMTAGFYVFFIYKEKKNPPLVPNP